MNLEAIQKLSLKETKTIEQRMLKLLEESGELAKEILIDVKASGSTHKEAGTDGVLGECVDVLLVAFSIFFAAGGSVKELDERIDEKSSKWKKYQTPTGKQVLRG